ALETARGARADHGPYAQRAERPDVGAVVDAVRRNRVASAVARHERHLAPGHLGQEDAVGRRPVGRIDLDLAYVVEQRIEARPAEDADLRPIPRPRSPAVLVSI